MLVLMLLTGCGSDTVGSGDAAPSSEDALAARSVEAGPVTVTATPIQLDGDGATIDIVLDTHAVELDTDLEDTAVLEVDGITWPVAAWTGDGPGGHHRTGQLQFDSAGPAKGTARLSIAGLPEPAEIRWNLDED